MTTPHMISETPAAKRNATKRSRGMGCPIAASGSTLRPDNSILAQQAAANGNVLLGEIQLALQLALRWGRGTSFCHPTGHT